jgi:outer membrane protein assembly factor BamB
MRCSRLQQIVLTFWIASQTVCSSLGDDWPQWRGPQRDGISHEKGLAKSWPEGGPKLLWQANELGKGYSTPSVVGDRLFVICNQGMEQESVIALSVSNGEKVWSTKIGSVGKNEGPQYPAARSTPTVSGDRLYALCSDGNLCCLDIKSGQIVWNKNLPKDFGGQPGQWAYSESPLVDGDTLICSPGGPSSTVVALNKKTGEAVWKSPLAEADKSSYSSPILVNLDGAKQVVLFLGKGAVGLKAETGEMQWRYSKTSDAQANIATPIASGNYVFTGASRVGGALIQLASAKSDPKEIYFTKSIPAGIGGGVLVDGFLYGSGGPNIMCVDFKTGAIKWQDRGIGAASVCYADGKLYLHGENNDVAMIAATPDGYQLLGKVTPPNAPDRGNGKAWTHPVISNGMLFVRDVGSVWCYNIR